MFKYKRVPDYLPYISIHPLLALTLPCGVFYFLWEKYKFTANLFTVFNLQNKNSLTKKKKILP